MARPGKGIGKIPDDMFYMLYNRQEKNCNFFYITILFFRILF